MQQTQSSPPFDQTARPFDIRPTADIEIIPSASPAWGAIFAGTIAGLATHILLLMLLSAVGFGVADPQVADQPVAGFATGTAVVWTISALLALCFGGWVTGRFAARVDRHSGGMHGFLMWCVATIAAMLMVVAGAGALVSGAVRVAGAGMSAAKAAAGGAADLAKEAVEQNTSLISSMVDEVAENPAVRNTNGGVVAARREIGLAARQVFREGGDLRDPQARAALVQALTRAGVSAADANGMVDRWTASAEQLRAQLEEVKVAAAAKAREAAEVASKAMAQASLWSFIGFLFGAMAAVWGGRRGSRWQSRRVEIETGVTARGHGPVASTRA